MTMESSARRAVLVRLIGRQTDHQWRRALIAEGLVIPTGGDRHVGLVDLTGTHDAADELALIGGAVGTEPLVVVIGMQDPIPSEPLPGIHVVRLDKPRIGPVVRMLRQAAHGRVLAAAASVRLRALSAMGRCYPVVRPEGHDGPAALLTDPAPSVLRLLSGTHWRELVAPLTSSQTLRLLEGHQASALVIHLTSDQDHRLPVLKLIRRQSELNGLPVAVISERWTEDMAAAWHEAGADLLAMPEELEAVLSRLRAAAHRFVTDRSLRLSLTNASMTDRGEPSPIMGCAMFDRLALEHRSQGDDMAFGAVTLEAEAHGGDADLAEAGVYMAMALSPVDFICRPTSDLFIVGMPLADKFYAGRTMRTLQTLIEDLKFGQEPDAVLLAARTAFTVGGQASVAEVRTRLTDDLASKRSAMLLA